jgi:hypothetical protein
MPSTATYMKLLTLNDPPESYQTESEEMDYIDKIITGEA